eukprot:706866-Rhodomonas_salina.2
MKHLAGHEPPIAEAHREMVAHVLEKSKQVCLDALACSLQLLAGLRVCLRDATPDVEAGSSSSDMHARTANTRLGA